MIGPFPTEAAPTTRTRRGAAASKSAISTQPVPARPGVLWADDDTGLNRLAERLLPESGFDVTVAADVATAMSVAARAEHAAMVLDQRFPDVPDLAVLQDLRATGSTMPVIVLTGYGSPASAVEALTLGVVDYQVKPASTARIVAALRIAIRMGPCRPLMNPPALALHPDASLALVSVLFNLDRADDAQLRTQLAWAASDGDDLLSFVELIAVVEGLNALLGASLEPEADRRRRVGAWLRRALVLAPSELSPEVRTFVELITADVKRTRHLRNEVLADESGASLGYLSGLLHEQLGASPDRCRLIAQMQPAIRSLARSDEQVAQIAYQLGRDHPSGFDHEFQPALDTSANRVPRPADRSLDDRLNL